MFNLSRVTDVEKLTSVAKDVLASNEHILGRNVLEFEKTFAKYIGVENCVGVANGSDAIAIALRALGVQKGDQVATVANAGFRRSIQSVNYLFYKRFEHVILFNCMSGEL